MFKNCAIYFWGLFFIFFCSCEKQKNIIKSSSIVKKQLVSSVIKFDKTLMFPKGISVSDSLIIIYEPKLKDGFISVYDLKSSKLITRFGSYGDAPRDFHEVRFLQNTFLHDKNDIIIGDDRGLYAINIDSILLGKILKRKIVNVTKEIIGYNYILSYNDPIVFNQTGNSQLTYYDPVSGKKEGKNYYKKNDKLKELDDFIYSSQLYDACYASNGKYIAIAYKNFKSVDFITLSGKLFNSCLFEDFDSNISKVKSIDAYNISIENGLVYYTSLYPTKDKLYALCWNADKKSIKNGIVKSEIHTFNWKGELLSIYELDKPVSYFCINDSENKIYAIGLNSNLDFEALEYNLKNK